MMAVKSVKTLYFLISFTLCYMQCDLKAISRKSPPKLIKMMKIVETEDIRVTNSNCGNLPSTVLSDVLGAAFNSRYMSIEPPKFLEEEMEEKTEKDTEEETENENSYTSKRNSEIPQPFYVEDTFALEISNKPAWEVRHVSEEHHENFLSADNTMTSMKFDRSRRDVHRSNKNMRGERPWECEAKIKWIDLGPDYFPRFLRSVECTKKKCWYNYYMCKPRSFTVKLLRRRNGECVQAKLHRTSNDELPGEFKELWVWEERAVNFCCDCVAS